MFSYDQIYNIFNSTKTLKPEIVRPTLRKIEGFSTDTREVLKNKVFFAIKGDFFDGSDFLLDAIKKDASLVICPKDNIPNTIDDVGIIAVEDTLQAYQTLANFIVKFFNPKIVGITGSNGKSTSKAMLHTIIKKFYNCEVSEKSFNNHIGVPHTLLKTRENTEVVIVEMGSNQKGDILNLAQIVQPEIAVVTNVANSHLEGLGSISGVAEEKKQIYNTAKVGVFNLDNEWTKKMYHSFKGEKITFSNTSDADIVLKVSDMNLDSLYISGSICGIRKDAKLEIFGKHNVYNVMVASGLALALGMKPSDIWDALSDIKGIWGRNQSVLLKNKATVIFDGYNANPCSVIALLENAKALSSKGRMFLCLADMLELGDKREELHEKIGKLVGQLPFEAVFFVGECGKYFERGVKVAGFKKSLVIFDSYKQALAIRLQNMLNEGDILFVKGSRGLKLENLIFDLKPLNF